MVPDADPADRLAAARGAIERDADELFVRWERLRAGLAGTWSSIMSVGQIAASMVRRRARNGEPDGTHR